MIKVITTHKIKLLFCFFAIFLIYFFKPVYDYAQAMFNFVEELIDNGKALGTLYSVNDPQ